MAQTALVGYTGFVGSNLLAAQSFTHLYNSKNFQEIAGQSFDLLVCAGVSAKKWVANAEPEKDLAEIKALAEVLVQAQVKEFILISTVDVYPKPISVNEDSSIDKSVSQAYGLNRLWLEEYIAAHFPNTRIIRLPGLFGPGLRKNAIYDFINDNNVDKIHQDGVFQFYNTARLWQDIETIRQHDLRLVNISSEPVSIQEIADQVFKQGWTNTMPTPGPRYDYWSKHAPIWNPASQHYMFSKEQVLEDIKAFVAKEPRTL